ncbi:MAG: hypothetical protein Q7J09_01555, partial [Methanocalculus sp.]|nr:hypothetical protein [Methanocalculus sp.]
MSDGKKERSFWFWRNKPQPSDEEKPEVRDDLEDLVGELIAATHEEEEKQSIKEETTYESSSYQQEKPQIIHQHTAHPLPLEEVVIGEPPEGIPIGFVQNSVQAEDEPEPQEQKPSKTSFFNRFSLKKKMREEYDQKTHDPLVDLTYKPAPGVEEIETYPVHPPYAYIRILYDVVSHEYTYQVIEPVLTQAEEDLYNEIKNRLFETLDISTRG